MIDVIVQITFSESGSRTWPILSGYRPLFMTSKGEFTSGKIDFIGLQRLGRGESCQASVTFLSPELIRQDLKIGNTLSFYEGHGYVGSAVVLKVLTDAENNE